MTMITKDVLNASIRDIELPDRMRCRPVSKQGYPVPHFVAKDHDGEWDFRVVNPATMIDCLKRNTCWMCGKYLGKNLAFVAGPMCVVTKTSAEPPCHLSCARYAAIACPFLSQPKMKRNEKDLPEGHRTPAGESILRNPGVAAVLVTRDWKPFSDGRGGLLIRMGIPERIEWYAQRRPATRDEVVESINSGLPLLFDSSPLSEHMEIRKSAVSIVKYLPRERA